MVLRGLCLLAALLPCAVAAAEEPQPWLPEYVESAEVVSVAGHAGTYVRPAKGHKLLGFVLYPASDPQSRPHGFIKFDNGIGQMEYGVTKNGSSATMTNAPLKFKRILFERYSNQLRSIELEAETG